MADVARDDDQDEEMNAEEDTDIQIGQDRGQSSSDERCNDKTSTLVVVGSSKRTSRIRLVHCAKKIVYWNGKKKLIEEYWYGFKLQIWTLFAGKWQYAVRDQVFTVVYKLIFVVPAGTMPHLHKGWEAVYHFP